MTNPTHTYMLTREAAQKAGAQVSSMGDYLERFIKRLEALNVAQGDPLSEKAAAARSAMVELGIAVAMASKRPGKTRWE